MPIKFLQNECMPSVVLIDKTINSQTNGKELSVLSINSNAKINQLQTEIISCQQP